MKNQLNFFLISLLFLFQTACQQAVKAPDYNIQKSTLADTAMVVSPHPLASEIGVDILQKGGNAVDATIAVQFALAVVYPRAGNIGGGGFMVVRNNDGTLAALDYREKAPAKAHRDMYLDENGEVIPKLSTVGHLAVGVPGTVDGLFAAHQKYGQLKDMKTLIQPAIDLAANGFAVTEEEAARLNRFQEAFRENNETPNAFFKDEWKAGDFLKQKDLAHTLELVRDQGRAGFYEGETADKIVAEMDRGSGWITLDDLKNYEAQWRTPIVGDYKDYKVISMPPSSSGGIALLQMLEMVEDYPLSEWGFQDIKSIHLMSEAMRRAYADRAEFLGDTDYYPVPIDSMLDDTYLRERMADFSPDSASVSSSILAGNFEVALESYETTHTSVVDGDGNAVSLTTTLNSNYGSKVVVAGAGFFLNNEMDDFSSKPGVPNQFGLIGNEANAIAPGKRMLSSMTPTIVEKGDELFMVLGTPGGSTIITSVFEVMLNVIEFGMPIDQAVSSPRFHHQWLPDRIMIEEGQLDSTKINALKAMGHNFHSVKSIAKVKAIHVREDGKLHGAADPRNSDDDAKGY